MSIKTTDENLSEDPRTIKLIDFVGQLMKIRIEFGLKPTTLHVSPADSFMTKFNAICGLRVVQDYNVPRGNVVLL